MRASLLRSTAWKGHVHSTMLLMLLSCCVCGRMLKRLIGFSCRGVGLSVSVSAFGVQVRCGRCDFFSKLRDNKSVTSKFDLHLTRTDFHLPPLHTLLHSRGPHSRSLVHKTDTFSPRGASRLGCREVDRAIPSPCIANEELPQPPAHVRVSRAQQYPPQPPPTAGQFDSR